MRVMAWKLGALRAALLFGLGACGGGTAAPQVDADVDGAAADGADDDDAAVGDGAVPEVAQDSGGPAEDGVALDAADAADALGPLAVPLAALCEPWAAVACQLTVGCRAATSSADLEACRAHGERVCEVARADVEARVAAGRASYDADQAGACLTAAALIACGPPEAIAGAVPAVCAGVFEGRVGLGEGCAAAGECEPGLYCATAGGASCPGTCRARPAIGATCDARFAPCAAGAWCEGGVCVAAAVAAGEVCAVSAQCPADAFCDESETPPRCRPPRGAGASCAEDEGCAAGLFCAVAELADTGDCAPQLGAGEVCTPFLSGGQCAAPQVCDMELARCVPPAEGVGDACVADWQPCRGGGLWCDPASETCAPLPALGGACGAGGAEGCALGACSASDGLEAGVCEAFVAPDEACEDDAQCGGLDCTGGRCGLDPAAACAPERAGLGVQFGIRIF